MSRCGLLRASWASAIAIAHILCTRLQQVRGPIGSLSKILILLLSTSSSSDSASPKYLRRQPPPPPSRQPRRWLSILLTFADECIFKSERIAEAAFPGSARLFDSIHRLADGLPAVFEDAMDRFSFLDLFGVSSKIGWLNLVVSAALSHYRGGGSNTSSSKSMKEKEITVDMGWCKKKTKKKKKKCDEDEDEEEDASFPALQCTKRAKQPQGTEESLQGACVCDEADNTEDASSTNGGGGGGGGAAKCTYKDVLTKGGGGDNITGEKSDNNGNGKKGKGEKDQILKLFDSSWSLC